MGRFGTVVDRVEELSDSAGPGNVVMIEIVSEHVTEVFTGFGRRGVRAEKVASDALRAAQDYLKADVPVGPYLADQLILPLGISAHTSGGGGSFRTMALSRHATTHIEIIRQFLDIDVQVERESTNRYLVRIR